MPFDCIGYDKLIFVLTDAGKPVFSTSNASNEEQTSLFGLLQAVPARVQQFGDKIHCLHCGNSCILYLIAG